MLKIGNVEIKNPVINNGQQTITTLIKTNQNLDKITISIKIIAHTRGQVKER